MKQQSFWDTGAREIFARIQTTQPQGGGKLTPLLTAFTKWTQRPVGRGGACLRPGPGPFLQKSYTHPWDTLQQPIIGLAPMDGVTDEPNRTMHGLYGCPDVVLTEFTNFAA